MDYNDYSSTFILSNWEKELGITGAFNTSIDLSVALIGKTISNDMEDSKADVAPPLTRANTATVVNSYEVEDSKADVAPPLTCANTATVVNSYEVEDSKADVAPPLTCGNTATLVNSYEVEDSKADVTPPLTRANTATLVNSYEIEDSKADVTPPLTRANTATLVNSYEVEDSKADVTPPLTRANTATVVNSYEVEDSKADVTPPLTRANTATVVNSYEVEDSKADVTPPLTRANTATVVNSYEVEDSKADVTPPLTRANTATVVNSYEVEDSKADVTPPLTRANTATVVNSYEVEDSKADVTPPLTRGNTANCEVEDSRATVPGVTPSLEDFRPTLLSLVDPRCLMKKISATLGEALNPLVSHLCSQPFAKVEFGRMRYEPVDDPSDRVECPEAFIPSNLFHHMKQPHHLGRYADFLGYHRERELRRDIEKLLHHDQNCKKTASVPSQLEQLRTSLNNTINFLTGIEASLQQKNESRLAGDMGQKIDELKNMKSKIELLCGQTIS